MPKIERTLDSQLELGTGTLTNVKTVPSGTAVGTTPDDLAFDGVDDYVVAVGGGVLTGTTPRTVGDLGRCF